MPFELGWADEHIENPYLIAAELAGFDPYFLSHGTAFELHGVVTQPNLTIYVSCTRERRAQHVGGYDFHFLRVRPEQVMGLAKHWVDKDRFIFMSDLEHTIIDGLKHPMLVGGITEVANEHWMRHEQLKIDRLILYAQKIGDGATVRRLGFLLELYDLANTEQIMRLRRLLTMTTQRLDPTLVAEGKISTRWRLRLNVTTEELQAVIKSSN